MSWRDKSPTTEISYTSERSHSSTGNNLLIISSYRVCKKAARNGKRL
jgi:hypothetical protein